ncbi:restriction endonuclease subunit S [Elizabethkingia anophelis]|uniref:Type I restriction-modification system, specificity subunit S n=2 Tax=Elizabethkingia anophelis TaxID=1117645 RepID=A0A455ZIL0_9FLAO|nr:restriction endonuclease subunit S [Elizabethkingia anophelis]AIL45391.1 Type I restriction-modification system, specificity subunit S [Elizabethkingia anophelis NUHP1]DAC76612.1 TPA_exp: Type I restriction-modification system, specificity subunit S [Elizabethkingia anophelis]
MENKKLKVGNVPPLRFPGFEGEWETKKLGEIMDFKVTNSFSRDNLNYENGFVKNIHYGDIHTKYQTLFDIANEVTPYINNEINIHRILEENYCQEGDVIFADASEDLKDVGKSIEVINLNGEKLLSGLHTLLARPQKNIFYLGFNGYLFKSNSVRTQIQKESQGTKVLSISTGRISKIKLSFPNLKEQQKIASFFSLIDQRIATQNKIIEELKLLKNTIRYQLYEQILNQKNDLVQVKDTLNYEQPTKYLVTNTDYSSDISLIPVLTANKSFVLGYTDEEFGIYDKGQSIIFDDFTMDIKFVDFLFKVKSSAIKILTAKPNVNLKFVFEYLSFLNLSSNEHKRHYISEIEPMEIQLPNYIQQTYVADFLSSIDDKIKTEFEFHMLLIKQKQYLLANLFI